MLGEDAASQPTVLTIDGLTGATIATVLVDDPYAANPDVVGGGAIRIVHQTTPGNFESATLDAVTGAITGLAGLSYSGFSADHGFDPGTNRLFEIGNLNGTGNLLTIDATNGMVMSSIVTADAHFGTAAVNGAGELLGLHGTMTVWHVARLNLTTGAITDLTPITLSAAAAGMGTPYGRQALSSTLTV